MQNFMKQDENEHQHYFNRYGIDSAVIRQLFDIALSKGGDYADIFFQHINSNHVGLEDNEVNRAYSNIALGVGIRVIKGDQVGYSFTENLALKSMKLAARTAAQIADAARVAFPEKIDAIAVPQYYPIETAWEVVSIDRKIALLNQVNEHIFSLDSRIIKATLSFYDSSAYQLIATSEGVMKTDFQPMTGMRASCIAEQNGRRENHGYDYSTRDGIEFYTPERLETLGRESVQRTLELFEAGKPEAGQMEVVLAAGSSGILLHEAIGHGMEADFNRKKVSIYADKLNKRIAREFVSVVDDGTNPNMRGSINFDDEGNPSQKTVLVENGILRSYMHDRISSRFYQVKPTGNGRRQSFRHAPVPRMRNTYMLPGPHKKDEIIASVKNGIYAENFTNGQVFIGAGDFTFYVKSGFMIEDGKLTRRIKDVNLIGNGPKVLEDVVMVGDDLEMAEGGWTCGKDGQGVPVSMGLPTVKVSSMTVGGMN
ncbi:TldD/PmbA family protein [candidate division KSB1 bacterium]|nr:TldD/PmbA family protein [candidate division KSB1 bacterium]